MKYFFKWFPWFPSPAPIEIGLPAQVKPWVLRKTVKVITMKKPKQAAPFRPSKKNAKLFADDAKRWGRETAIYNQGFLAGDDNGKKRGHETGFERAMLLMMGSGVKWTDAERRLGNSVTRKLFGKKR